MELLRSLLFLKYVMLAVVLGAALGAQASVERVGHARKTKHLDAALCEGYSGCSGFSRGGREYAVIGCYSGVWIVDATNPEKLTEVGFFDRRVSGDAVTPPTFWREVACFRTADDRQFVFSVADDLRGPVGAHSGLHVLEVSGLPSDTLVREYVLFKNSWGRAHTLRVDPVRGRLYVNGATRKDVAELVAFDISEFDPAKPPPELLRCPFSSHDSFSRNGHEYFAILPSRFVAYRTEALATHSPLFTQWPIVAATPHNLWVSEDERLIAVSEEGTPGVLVTYRVEPPIRRRPMALGIWASRNQAVGSSGFHAPHNVEGIGRSLYVAGYTSGFHFLDMPDSSTGGPVEIASYDTSPPTVIRPPGPFGAGVQGPPVPKTEECGSLAGTQKSDHYYGAWACYPYQDSGYVYVADTDTGLHVLDIPWGHFHRERLASPGANGQVPNIYPNRATPRVGASPFELVLSGLGPGAVRYELIVSAGVSDESVSNGRVKSYVDRSKLVFLSLGATSTGKATVAWKPSAEPFVNLYAQVFVIGADRVPIASSRLIRFGLLR